MTEDKTPFELGFRMPAEWERHEATWLSWPKEPLTFPDNIIDRVEQIYVKMIEALQRGERVDLLIDDQKTEDRVEGLLSSKNNVRFHKIKSADVWMRDYGPIFVKHSNVIAATKWIFNAWGKKYDELLRDNESGTEICKATRLQVFEPRHRAGGRFHRYERKGFLLDDKAMPPQQEQESEFECGADREISP